MTTNLKDPQAPVTNEELDQLIWGLERYGLYPRQLAALKELREVRRAKPYGYVNRALYEEIGCSGLTNDHEAYADSSTHIPLYRIPQAASAVKPAMLNAEKLNQPVSETNFAGTQIKPVADLYGITSPTGSETTFTFDAGEASRFADSGWSVQEYVELERYQEAMVGNSPATPDSWIPVSEAMPENMDTVLTCNGFDIGHGWWDGDSWQEWSCHDKVPGEITHWKPLPEPPKEVG